MKVFKLVSILSLSVLATACGNTTRNTDDLRSNQWNTNNPSSTTNPYANEAQNCSSAPNVNSPQTGSGYSFSACKSNQNLRVFSADGSNRSVCVFPVNVYNNGAVYPLVYSGSYPAINNFFVQCTTTPNTGGTVSFGNAQYNGVYIVDQAVAGTFAQCMAYGDVRTCSQAAGINYAAGLVR